MLALSLQDTLLDQRLDRLGGHIVDVFLVPFEAKFRLHERINQAHESL